MYNDNDREIYFNTINDAREALRAAYKKLSSDVEDWEASLGSYGNDSLSYDAGRAEILEA